jgi:hypothetical protein
MLRSDAPAPALSRVGEVCIAVDSHTPWLHIKQLKIQSCAAMIDASVYLPIFP